MKLRKESTEIYVPDGTNHDDAIKRTTHMTIAAHQDDIEIMAYDGISKGIAQDDKWHFGVVVTDGAGSPRSGMYAQYTDQQMQKVRKSEQKKAAYVGKYGALALLDYTSSEVKDLNNIDTVADIMELVRIAKPDVIYTHNLADSHDTHVAVVIKVIKALRELDDEYLPKQIYGCEVWRGLDWLCDDDKLVMDVGSRSNMASSLLGVFDSQICGGKRYDLATMGRQMANATFYKYGETDTSSALSYAIDLMPLLMDKDMSIEEYMVGYIQRFMDDVVGKIRKMN